MFPPGGHPESIRWSLCEGIEGEDSAAVRRDATAEDRRVFGLPRPRPPGAFHNKNLYLSPAESRITCGGSRAAPKEPRRTSGSWPEFRWIITVPPRKKSAAGDMWRMGRASSGRI